MSATNWSDKVSELTSAGDWHVLSVYSDPDFEGECARLNALNDEDGIKALAAKFKIEPYDMFYYRSAKIIRLPINRRGKAKLGYDKQAKRFTIDFEPSISKQEFMELWEEFDNVRDGFVGGMALAKSKRKPPENPKLIYSVFKARIQGMSFPDIFKSYLAKTLPGYEGRTPTHLSDDDLERYYNRYKPKQTFK